MSGKYFKTSGLSTLLIRSGTSEIMRGVRKKSMLISRNGLYRIGVGLNEMKIIPNNFQTGAPGVIGHLTKSILRTTGMI